MWRVLIWSSVNLYHIFPWVIYLDLVYVMLTFWEKHIKHVDHIWCLSSLSLPSWIFPLETSGRANRPTNLWFLPFFQLFKIVHSNKCFTKMLQIMTFRWYTIMESKAGCANAEQKSFLWQGKFSDQFSEIKIYGTPANLPTITIEVVTLGSKP